MPAGTDVWDYAPRKGTTGDDRYDMDAGTPWSAGPATYSTPPTYAEIQAGSGINQIIALVNFRMKFYNDAINDGVSSFTPLTYVAAGDRNLASKLSVLKSNADTIRSQENLSAFTWTVSFAAGQRVTRQHILELRKALATDHFFYPWPILNTNGRNNYTMTYTKVFPGYPPDTTGTFSTGTPSTTLPGGFQSGQSYNTGTSNFHAIRQFVDLHLPSYATNINAVGAWFNRLGTVALSGSPAGTATAALELYLCNTYQSGTPVAADWNKLDNLIGTGSVPAGTSISGGSLTGATTVNISPAATPSTLSAGSNYTFETCTTRERTNSTDGTGATSGQAVASGGTGTRTLKALLLYT